MPQSLSGWKVDYFFVDWKGGNWSSLFRTSFKKALDGRESDLHLSLVDKMVVLLLQADQGTTPYSEILTEANLKAVGLSNLDSEATKLLQKMMHTRNTRGEGGETQRQKKRRTPAESSSGAEATPDPTPEPELVPEPQSSRRQENASFHDNWGFRDSDSVMGNSTIAVKWSKGGITPADQEQFVDNLEYDQIESMSCQYLASLNVVTNAVLKRLRDAEADKKLLSTSRIPSEEVDSWKSRTAISENEKVEALQDLQNTIAQLQRATERIQSQDARIQMLEAREQSCISRFVKSETYRARKLRTKARKLPEVFNECFEIAVAELKSHLSGIDLSGVNFESPIPKPTNPILDETDSDEDPIRRYMPGYVSHSDE